MTSSTLDSQSLSWSRGDIEQRLGFRGGRFTRVNNWLSFLLGTAAVIIFYVVLMLLPSTWIAQSFTQRGPTPYFIAWLSFWSLAILFFKWRKLVLQRQALQCDVVPSSHDFVLSPATVDQVSQRILSRIEDPRQFVLFNRIMIALSNLRNLGRVTDVDDILRSQGEHDESGMETSYSLVRGFIWAIPVLGFIGTVLGLSQAVGGFGNVLGNSKEISQLVESLKMVTGGLATAFETTLQALVAALIIQILLTFLKKGEEEFLDSCAEYCLSRIVNRLRLVPFEQEAETT